MEHAVLSPHDPIIYELFDGSKFEASRIAVLQSEEAAVIRVSGVLQKAGDGPVSRILVIAKEGVVDLKRDLRGQVGTELLAGNFDIL